jgi:AmmeMemoRadiSam system protein A
MHPVVELAKKTIETFVKEGRVIEPPDTLSPEMKEQAGVFVSLKKKGQLRGCIGTFQPTTRNVAQEVIQNAISAATKDPRFSPVSVEELDKIDYSVDILSPPEPVREVSDLDPRRYGIIVQSGWKKGLLLPNIEGVDSVDEQINIASMKAGITPDEDIELYRFEVRRFR